jgi:ribonuclease HI
MKYLLYTDGSCDNLSIRREGGYAYVILDQKKNVVKSFSKGTINTTNNIMELTAIIEGCKAIPEDNAEVAIYSDSQYALNVLSGKWKGQANRSLINNHKANKKRLRLQYNWIKGHCGNKYNDMVDLMAETELNNMRMEHGIDVVNSHEAYKRAHYKNKW